MRLVGLGFLTLGLIFGAHPGLSQNSELDINQVRETLLFGPEVTFTNTTLIDISKATVYADRGRHEIPFTAQTLPTVLQQLTQGENPFTITQIREITRFLTDVLPVSQGTLHLHYTKQIEPGPPPLPLPSRYDPHTQHKVHKQPITLAVQLPGNIPAVVTLEPGCIEVNQAPVLFKDLEPVWGDIFDRAQAQNFVGNIFGPNGESIGGGGHLHLGFQYHADNLFLNRPDVLLRLWLLPLHYPGIMYMLHDREDFGPHSTIRTPFEEKSTTQTRMLRFIWDLEHLGHRPRQTRPQWLRNKAPDFTVMHNQHLSLKGFSNRDYRVEVRFQRSFNTLADLQAIAEFWILSLAALSQGATAELSLPNFDKGEDFYGTRPTTLIAQFKSWLTRIGMPQQYRRKLLHFGGDDTLTGIHTSDQTHPVFKHTKAYPLMGDPNHAFHYEVLIPIPPDLPTGPYELYVMVAGNRLTSNEFSLVRDSQRTYVSLVLDGSPHRRQVYPITLSSREDPKKSHTLILSLLTTPKGRLSLRVATDVSRFFTQPTRLLEAHLQAKRWAMGDLKDQIINTGMSLRKYERLWRNLPTIRALPIRWALLITDTNIKKIEAIHAFTVNGYILPHEIYETGQVNLYAIHYTPPPGDSHPYDILVSALNKQGEPLFAKLWHVVPHRLGRATTYHRADFNLDETYALPFSHARVKDLLVKQLSSDFRRDVLLKSFRLIWRDKKDKGKTYAALRRFERRLKKCSN